MTEDRLGMRLLRRRSLVLVMLLLGMLALAVPCSADYFVHGDLQLLTWESLALGSHLWTAPIETATILAWFSQHGYPALLPDLNGDGWVNEIDSLQLADTLGDGLMETSRLPGTTDAALVWGLASYLAEIQPDTFEIHIYDQGFKAEWQVDSPGWLALGQIPGVQFLLQPEPTFNDYQREMLDGAMIILGLEGIDEGLNTYLAGRSFDDSQAQEGVYGIDMAWAEDNPDLSGLQGQVLDTISQHDDGWWVLYGDVWVRIEFMLALIPVKDVSSGPPSIPRIPDQGACCPDLVPTVEAYCDCNGPDGCVVVWTTTIEQRTPGCSVGPFKLQQDVYSGRDADGFAIYDDYRISIEDAMLDELNATGILSFTQFHIVTDMSGQPTDSEFRVVVIADELGEIDECTQEAEDNNIAEAVGACFVPAPDLPDLIVEAAVDCQCSLSNDNVPYCLVTVTATVRNLSPWVSIAQPFTVLMDASPWGGSQQMVVDGPALDELNLAGETVLTFSFSPGGRTLDEPCGGMFIHVDSDLEITETDEFNNAALPEVCCAFLPDLVLEAASFCECSFSTDYIEYCQVQVDVMVRNANPQWPIMSSFDVTMDPGSIWGGVQTYTIEDQDLTTLNNVGEVLIHFVFSPGGRGAPDPRLATIVVTVDPDNRIRETSDVYVGQPVNELWVDTVCPPAQEDAAGQPPTGECPDLIVTIDEALCSCEDSQMGTGVECEMVVDVTVKNIGAIHAEQFYVKLDGDSGSDTVRILGLQAGGEVSLTLSYEYEAISASAEEIEVKADSRAHIDECSELNNTDEERVTCR